jgi:hypothetical protein
LRELLHLILAEHLLNLVRRNGLVLTGADPGPRSKSSSLTSRGPSSPSGLTAAPPLQPARPHLPAGCRLPAACGAGENVRYLLEPFFQEPGGLLVVGAMSKQSDQDHDGSQQFEADLGKDVQRVLGGLHARSWLNGGAVGAEDFHGANLRRVVIHLGFMSSAMPAARRPAACA